MAAKQLAITTAHIREYLMMSERAISWPVDIGTVLEVNDLDRMDVLHVLKSIEVSENLKGALNGSEMVAEGQTCEGVTLQILYRIDPLSSDIIVDSVTQI
ncbi:hypothetical protein GCM10009096_13240 [Parasphingorhabdus litoris]|uniref:Uncharacterized protein n=1 Tax=Parasphingorhabdus litoris TaxID=394733 RepID=A0ABP3K7C7_9SPHN|nr:hypothetical protein [Parasphingorhabdus litoris]